jgi:hypothetical protein
MHLVGPYLTTTNYKKRKVTITKAQMSEWQEEYRLRCKSYKRMGISKPTFEEFIDSIHGRVKKQPPKFEAMKSKPESLAEERIRQNKEQYKSLVVTDISSDACSKRESQKYTGTLIKGIATMHKSNAVPILNQQDAEEISKMRR